MSTFQIQFIVIYFAIGLLAVAWAISWNMKLREEKRTIKIKEILDDFPLLLVSLLFPFPIIVVMLIMEGVFQKIWKNLKRVRDFIYSIDNYISNKIESIGEIKMENPYYKEDKTKKNIG